METVTEEMITKNEYDALDNEGKDYYEYAGYRVDIHSAMYKLRTIKYQPKQQDAPAVENIMDTLNERGTRYGKFTDHAAIAQGLKGVVYGRDGYNRMQPDAKQAVDVIFNKIARMVNGDPEYDDNWRDIIGYATLVLNRIQEDQKKRAAIRHSCLIYP